MMEAVHGAFRAAEHGRDLRRRQPVDVTKDQDLPLVRGQLPQGVAQRPAAFV